MVSTRHPSHKPDAPLVCFCEAREPGSLYFFVAHALVSSGYDRMSSFVFVRVLFDFCADISTRTGVVDSACNYKRIVQTCPLSSRLFRSSTDKKKVFKVEICDPGFFCTRTQSCFIRARCEYRTEYVRCAPAASYVVPPLTATFLLILFNNERNFISPSYLIVLFGQAEAEAEDDRSTTRRNTCIAAFS